MFVLHFFVPPLGWQHGAPAPRMVAPTDLDRVAFRQFSEIEKHDLYHLQTGGPPGGTGHQLAVVACRDR